MYRQETDFEEVNEEIPFAEEPVTAHTIIEPELYNRTILSDLKDMLWKAESFDDMVAMRTGCIRCL